MPRASVDGTTKMSPDKKQVNPNDQSDKEDKELWRVSNREEIGLKPRSKSQERVSRTDGGWKRIPQSRTSNRKGALSKTSPGKRY